MSWIGAVRVNLQLVVRLNDRGFAMVALSAIMVLYNKELDNSITYKSLLKCNTGEFKVNLIVIDNSTNDNNNFEACKNKGIMYVDMQGNKGISKAYNAGLDHVGDSEIIVLLDDDTELTTDYFEKLYRKVVKHPNCDIFAPIVVGQDNKIYSPNEFRFLKNINNR